MYITNVISTHSLTGSRFILGMAASVISHRRRESAASEESVHSMADNPMAAGSAPFSAFASSDWVEMRLEYADASHDQQVEASRMIAKAWQRKVRKSLPIARCQIKAVGATIEDRSRGMAALIRYVAWVFLFIVMVLQMRNPPQQWITDNTDGAKRTFTPSFRPDYSQQRAIVDALDQAEWDGVGSSHKDVITRANWYAWLKSLVGAIYDEDEYNSRNFARYVKAKTAEGHRGLNKDAKSYLADYNKVFSSVFITQQRRGQRLCDEAIASTQVDSYHTLIPVCYDGGEVHYSSFAPNRTDVNAVFASIAAGATTAAGRDNFNVPFQKVLMEQAFDAETAADMGGYFTCVVASVSLQRLLWRLPASGCFARPPMSRLTQPRICLPRTPFLSVFSGNRMTID